MSPPHLALLCLNARGLRSPEKQSRIRQRLFQGRDRLSIACLQETHATRPGEVKEWLLSRPDRRGTRPATVFSCNGPQGPSGQGTGGVATVVLPSPLLGDPTELESTADGRALVIRVSWAGQPLVVCNVYAPHSATDRRTWFSTTLRPLLLRHCRDVPVLLAGDWNCVLSALDIVGPGADPTGRREGSVELQSILDGLHLLDVHRSRDPDLRLVTHATTAPNGLPTGARLDRVYCSPQLLPSLQEADVEFGFRSDHIAVTASFAGPAAGVRDKRSWRLPPHVLLHKEFREAIPRLFHQHVLSTPLSPTLTRGMRWDHFCLAVRHLSVTLARRIAEEARAHRKGLLSLASDWYQAFLRRPTDSTLRGWRAAHDDLCAFEAEEALTWERCQQALWQHAGERCSLWFYDSARRKQAGAANSFSHVRDETGTLHPLDTPTNALDAGTVFSNFYSSDHPQGLFREPTISSDAQDRFLAATKARLSPQDRDISDAASCPVPITAAELHIALASSPPYTAPGPDGLPYAFYQQFWDVVGEELAAVLNEAFELRYLPYTMRQGTIILLHKEGPRDLLGNYRPITLLNCSVKLLAKALALRLRHVLHHIIGPQQTAFIPHRSIVDNILNHLAVIEDCETRVANGERCTTSIAFVDFQKAYDSLSRGWLHRVLAHFGFGARFQRWVEVLYTDPVCRVEYNNWLSPPFPVRSGVRQGCPLSPALFVAAVEPLAAYLNSLVAARQIRLHVLSGGILASLINQHADDTTLKTADAASRALAVVVVDGFRAASGLRQRPDKGHLLDLSSPTPDAAAGPPTAPPPTPAASGGTSATGLTLAARPATGDRSNDPAGTADAGEGWGAGPAGSGWHGDTGGSGATGMHFGTGLAGPGDRAGPGGAPEAVLRLDASPATGPASGHGGSDPGDGGSVPGGTGASGASGDAGLASGGGGEDYGGPNRCTPPAASPTLRAFLRRTSTADLAVRLRALAAAGLGRLPPDVEAVDEMAGQLRRTLRAHLHPPVMQPAPPSDAMGRLNQVPVCPHCHLPVVQPQSSVRHLGIRLAHSLLGCKTATYDALLARVRRSAGLWAAAQLSLLGSAHVGKQVLGNTIGHFVGSLAPPPEARQALTSAISSFVATGHCAVGGAPLPIARERAAFPASRGGLGAPHAPAIMDAHQARILLTALGPGRRHWQCYFRHQLRLTLDPPPGQAPDFHAASTLLLSTSPLPPTIRPLLRDAIIALRAAKPHVTTQPLPPTLWEWLRACPALTVPPRTDPATTPWPPGPYALHLHSATEGDPHLAACSAALTPLHSHSPLASISWALWSATPLEAEWASLFLGASLAQRFAPSHGLCLHTPSARIARAVAHPSSAHPPDLGGLAAAALSAAQALLFLNHQPHPPGQPNPAAALTGPAIAEQRVHVQAGLDPSTNPNPSSLPTIGPAPGSWVATGDAAWVRGGPTGVPRWYYAAEDGRLWPGPPPPDPIPPLAPATVLFYRPLCPSTDAPLGKEPPLYLLGLTHEVVLDPCRLLLGTDLAIAARVRTLTARNIAAEVLSGAGTLHRFLQPACWRPSPGEASRLDRLDRHLAYSARTGRPPPPPPPDWASINYMDTPAHRPSPPRLSPWVRAANRPLPPPPFPTSDPLAALDAPAPPWAATWRFLTCSSIPTECKDSYWLVLHAALHTEAWHAAFPSASDPRHHHPFCAAEACSGACPPATIRHVVWDCPIAQACWGYASAFLTVASNAPCSIALCHLLPSRPGHLPPPGIPEAAVPFLRLILSVMVHHLTTSSHPAVPPDPPRSSLAIISAFQSTIRSCIHRDWVRTQLGALLDEGPEIPLTRCIRPWSREAFEAQWPGQDVWFRYSATAGPGGDRLVVALDLTSPLDAAPFTGAR